MIQLKVLSGKKAGTVLVARRFPFLVGRLPASDLCLEDPGVWDKHFQINLDSSLNFVLATEANTSAVIEGEVVREKTPLRNGDLIEAGSAKILFGLSPARQKSLRWREVLTWISLGALCLGQIALIHKLL